MLLRNTLYHVNSPELSSINRHKGTRTDKQEEDAEIGFETFVEEKEISRQEGFAATSSKSGLVLFFNLNFHRNRKI